MCQLFKAQVFARYSECFRESLFDPEALPWDADFPIQRYGRVLVAGLGVHRQHKARSAGCSGKARGDDAL